MLRLRILLLGDDPISIMADSQLLRERGMAVFTAFNLANIGETITEVKPDVVFFDPHTANISITDAYNEFVNSIHFTNIPVIFTLLDDDVYLVTRKRTDSKEKRNIIADNMLSAVKLALRSSKTYQKKLYTIPVGPPPSAKARA